MIEPRMMALSFTGIVLFLSVVATWRLPPRTVMPAVLDGYWVGIALMVLGSYKSSDFLQDLGTGFCLAMIALSVVLRLRSEPSRTKPANTFTGSR